MAVFFLTALVGAAFAYGNFPTEVTARVGVLGGPARPVPGDRGTSRFQAVSSPLILPSASAAEGATSGEPRVSGFFPGSVADAGQPIGPSFTRSDLVRYTIRKGNTLLSIASYFGISLETLLGANPSLKSGIIRPGDELNVLPVAGVVYKTADGDTLESVSGYFGISEESIKQFNKSINFTSLGAGISLIIPGGKKSAYRGSTLPDLKSYFSKPAEGLNLGKLHPQNAVDIVNSCGTPVLAAAEGLVIPDENLGDGHSGWNNGYGIFVLMEHPFGNGVRTRYSHLKESLVGIGDYVKQGQQIGTMGDTGDAVGCHVHFEVDGAENPLAK